MLTGANSDPVYFTPTPVLNDYFKYMFKDTQNFYFKKQTDFFNFNHCSVLNSQK
jgi:hypothetical protein